MNQKPTFTSQFSAIFLVLTLLNFPFLAGCQSGLSGGASGLTEVRQGQIDRAVERVKPSLVRIKVVSPMSRDGRIVQRVSYGSGSIISADGYVVTNHHVAAHASQLVVTLPNREEISARLVGSDAATDIAVIQLMPDSPSNFPYVTFGNSDRVEVGDPVLAMGSPLALSQSVTLGIVSNTAMILPGSTWGMELDGENVGELLRWFAHDAQIYGGNSGGPLVNLNGEIIGVNMISYGLGGAIPGNLARHIADQIIHNDDHQVARAFLGMQAQPMLKRHQGLTGALIGHVVEDSPAGEAGLQTGDILKSINGETVRVQFREDLPVLNNIIANLPIGQPAQFSILRDGEDHQISVTPERRQPAWTADHEFRSWGVTARDITMLAALSLARDDQRGVIFTSLGSGGGAAQAQPPLRRGDVLLRVNDHLIGSIEDLQRITAEIMEGQEGKVSVIATYERDGEQLLTVVELGIDDLEDPGREVRRAWLPIETQVLMRNLAEEMGIEGTPGVRVTRLYDWEDQEFPFEVGDILTHMDGEVINASQLHDIEVFRQLLRQYPVNSEVDFRLLRNGEELTVATRLVREPQPRREMRRYRDLDFGFIVREMSFFDKSSRHFQGLPINIQVDAVTQGSWANLAGLRSGDGILEIEGTVIDTLDDVALAMEEVHRLKPQTVVMKVRRGPQFIFVEIEPIWDALAEI